MKNQSQYSANCDLLQTGDKASDHAHITKVTPMQTKAKELADDKKYRTQLSAGLNTERQSSTTRKRRQTPGHNKPI